MRDVLDDILLQHAEEAAFLWMQRWRLVTAPHVSLSFLEGHDERLSAHLDGLELGGEAGWKFCESELEGGSAGAVFAATTLSLKARHEHRLDRLIAFVGAVPEVRRGLVASFGWVSPDYLQHTVKTLLSSTDSLRRLIGISACALHRVDPRVTTELDSACSARALRAAGEIGKLELLPLCLRALAAEDTSCQFWAAFSAVLLGNRREALQVIESTALSAGPMSGRALELSLQAMSRPEGHTCLQKVAQKTCNSRRLYQGTGIVGDPAYVPWLIAQMRDRQTARAAGEAFSLITGADLPRLSLDRTQPEDFESRTDISDDDSNIEADGDEDLPWPDTDRIQDWWAANSSRFQTGTRYFTGAPVTWEHCIDVLKNGYQRRRSLAARYLCLLRPGTPLFNTSAPAWRQQELLTQMR